MKHLDIHYIIKFLAHEHKSHRMFKKLIEWCKEKIQTYGSSLFQFLHVVSNLYLLYTL